MEFDVLRKLKSESKDIFFKYQQLIALAGKIWLIAILISLTQSIIFNMRDLNPVLMWQNFLKLSFHMSIGYGIHISLLILFIKKQWLPETKSIKGLFPFFLTGAGATFIVFLAVKPDHLYYTWSFFSMMGFVFSICLIMQLFLLNTTVYSVAIEEQIKMKKNKLLKGASLKRADYVVVQVNKETMEQVILSGLSTLYVEDHYLHFVYQTSKGFRTIIAYGKLMDFEKSLGERFLKINRSTLIQPQFIKNIFKNKARYSIVMQGLEHRPILVPKSRNQLIQLLPEELILEGAPLNPSIGNLGSSCRTKLTD